MCMLMLLSPQEAGRGCTPIRLVSEAEATHSLLAFLVL